MAKITVSTINSLGYDLFSGEESYIQDLSDEQLNIQGGLAPLFGIATAIAFGVSAVGAGATIAIAKLIDRKV